MKVRSTLAILLGILGTGILTAESFAIDIYVNSKQTSGNGSGDSWANAIHHLQDGIAALAGNTKGTLFVAEGIYYPDQGGGQTDNDQFAVFTLPEGTRILGGYIAGTGERRPDTNRTILSGDIDQASDLDGDGLADSADMVGPTASFDLVGISGNPAAQLEAVLDGLYFTSARNAAVRANDTSLTVRNCHFVRSLARAIFLTDSQVTFPNTFTCVGSSFVSNGVAADNTFGGGVALQNLNATFTDCVFEDNQTFVDRGGGVACIAEANANSTARLEIQRCSFKGNRAIDGGGIYVLGPVASVITNSAFSGNVAGNFDFLFSRGGGAYIGQQPGNENHLRSGPIQIRFCTFAANNSNAEGGGLYFSGTSSKQITDSIFYLNTVGGTTGIGDVFVADLPLAPNYVRCYSSTPDFFTGPNNFDTFEDAPSFRTPFVLTQIGTQTNSIPYFSPSTEGDLRLTQGSSLKDEGDNAAISGDQDVDRNGRIRNLIVDIGAYEAPNPSEIQIFEVTAFYSNPLVPSIVDCDITFEADVPVNVWRSLDLESFSLLDQNVSSPYKDRNTNANAFYKLIEVGGTP